MDLEIRSEEENNLLGRSEVKASLSYSGETPSVEDVRDEIARVTESDSELVVVNKVDQKFGVSRADVDAYVYEDESSLEEIEDRVEEESE